MLRDPSPHRLCGFFLSASVNAWLALGGFDEEYAGYGCDDTDFSIRAHARGVRLFVDPLAFVWHRGGITYRGDDVERLRQQARATFREKTPDLPPYTVPPPWPGCSLAVELGSGRRRPRRSDRSTAFPVRSIAYNRGWMRIVFIVLGVLFGAYLLLGAFAPG